MAHSSDTGPEQRLRTWVRHWKLTKRSQLVFRWSRYWTDTRHRHPHTLIHSWLGAVARDAFTTPQLQAPERVPRFLGGTTGRSGTTWLEEALRLVLAPQGHVVVGERHLFTLSQFRGAPYEYYQSAGSPTHDKRHYLPWFHRFMMREGYRIDRMFGMQMAGSAGAGRLIKKQPMRTLLASLDKDLEGAASLDSCYQIWGRFYCALFDHWAWCSSGTSDAPWISKEPPYGRHAAELLRMVPQAKLVILVRDGRDVALSKLRLGWVRTLEEGFDRWRVFTQSTLDQIRTLDSRSVLLMRYEDLVHDLETNFPKILHFYGIDAAVDYAALRSRTHFESSSGWRKRLGAAEQALFSSRCGGLAQELGYPL